MSRINTTSWGEFKILDIFVTNKKGNKIQVPTGASVPAKDLIEGGTIPRITVSGINNGILGMFDYSGNKPSCYRVFNNFISISFLGTVFYQEENATLDMKVHCLKPLHIVLNKYTGQYLVGAIKASLRESSYADQISSTILPEMKIKLPVDSSGNPDWEYMEQYMKNIEVKVCDKISKLESVKDIEKKKVDITQFKKFHLYDKSLFTIESGTKLDKIRMTKSNPSIVFVGRANANNGVTDYIDIIQGLKPYEAGLLTLSLGGEYLGSCFVQEKEFYTSQNVNVLIPNREMSIYVKKYIATMIFKESRTHYKAFIDELNRHIKTDFTILLPVDINGEPDWDYMEAYMKQIEDMTKTKLDLLT